MIRKGAVQIEVQAFNDKDYLSLITFLRKFKVVGACHMGERAAMWPIKYCATASLKSVGKKPLLNGLAEYRNGASICISWFLTTCVEYSRNMKASFLAM